MPIAWTESEFEEWFLANPALPGDDRLAVVVRQRSLKRVVDLLCLDREGRIVLLEVKNEPSTRYTIGQAFEYLAATADQTLEDLADECPQDLLALLSSTWQHPPQSVQPGRRVVLVAPKFDPPSVLAASYLNEHLKESAVEVLLLEAHADPGGFSLKWHDGPRFVRSRALGPGFATNGRGRFFYVLRSGPNPVMWDVGKLTPAGLRPLKGRSRARRTVRCVNRHMAQWQPLDEVELVDHGSVWRHRTKPGRCARMLGTLDLREGPLVAFVLFRAGEIKGCRLQRAAKFAAEWERCAVDLSDWESIAKGLAHHVA